MKHKQTIGTLLLNALASTMWHVNGVQDSNRNKRKSPQSRRGLSPLAHFIVVFDWKLAAVLSIFILWILKGFVMPLFK